jgi:2-oxoglutarate ferredoxin oxidoreductase subunit beta
MSDTARTETASVDKTKVSKKLLMGDHPTWCPGCGDFSVLALFLKLCEEEQLSHSNILTVAGIGCSSRFPYFVNAYGVHYVHGRAVALASGISLTRPDIHVFVFGGDGDAFSIGGNHMDHAARKNVRMTYVIMDNFVYGLTKKQTSPTSPLGFKSRTDVWGVRDHPVNPMKKLIAAGCTFIARTVSTNPKHLLEMLRRAKKHDGFSVVEVLSECTEFYRGAFDGANPRKGGDFVEIEEKAFDGTPEDASRHDATDEIAAYRLADEPFPGRFGVFYQVQRPSKNAIEADLIRSEQEKYPGDDLQRMETLFSRFT